MTRVAALLAPLGVLSAVILACSTPAADGRFVATPPDRASFNDVANLLEHRCGSLDCHGSTWRNMRLYGHEGLRLDPNSRPSSQANTTTAEYDEDFLSIVLLEPEVMSAVVNEGGANPERLSLVRKARGLDHHKGGTLITQGDVEDKCILSWLSGKTDTAGCQAALSAARP